MHPSGSTYVFLKALLAANGMSIADIKQSTVAPPYENYLILGRVDAVPGYIDAEVPELAAKAGGAGIAIDPAGLRFRLDGLWLGHVHLVQADRRQARLGGALHRRPMRCAFKDVVENPADAVQITGRGEPGIPRQDRTCCWNSSKADIKHTFFNADTKANGIGHIDPGTWEDTVKLLRDQGSLAADAKVEGAFDNRFIAGAKALLR